MVVDPVKNINAKNTPVVTDFLISYYVDAWYWNCYTIKKIKSNPFVFQSLLVSTETYAGKYSKEIESDGVLIRNNSAKMFKERWRRGIWITGTIAPKVFLKKLKLEI